MLTFLLSMYCFEFNNKCTCIAFSDKDQIILGRNSDFLVELEKLYMDCLYNLDNCYSFNGNTTAFVEMEDAHIYDGDLVYVQSCSTVESGRIAVVMINDEATIKKVYFKDNLMILEPANPKYESKFFTMKEVEEMPVRVIGLVRFVRTDFV